MSAALIAGALAPFVLAACTPQGSGDAASAGAGTAVPVPRQLRMIDPNTLRLDGVIAGRSFSLTAPDGNGRWAITLTVPEGVPLRTTLTWSDRDGLPLARFDGELPALDRDGAVRIGAERYSTAPFDDDGDSATNVEELRCGTDPTDASSVPTLQGDDCGESDTAPSGETPVTTPGGTTEGEEGVPAAPACGTNGGSDARSSNFDWNDNCTISRPGPFARSLYTVGVQRILNCESGTSPDAADGDFGPLTDLALVLFQIQNGLTADAVVGAQTWAALQARLVRVSRAELIGSGPFFDGYGVVGACSDSVLFYNEVALAGEIDVQLFGWTLARRANSAERLPFSTAEPFGLAGSPLRASGDEP